MRTLLVTGGAGFIGSNFIKYLTQKYQDYTILNLDSLTYASNYKSIEDLERLNNYRFLKLDINDKPALQRVFEDYPIDGVIHLAAESHVDNSISGPEIFLQTNIMGTYNLLQECKKAWVDVNHTPKSGHENSRFLHVSTDEVYGSLGDDGLFTEDTKYAPNSPYSASKASSDFLVRAYNKTYGLNVVTTNCSNNYGPMQHGEKLIPKIIANAILEKEIPIYGDGKNIRDWLYVTDHCRGIDLAFHQGKSGQTYNIGGHNEKTNNEIVEKICEILNVKKPRQNGKRYQELICYVQDRAGHDKRYAIDSSKIEDQLNWRANENFDTGIEKTVNWYLEKHEAAQ